MKIPFETASFLTSALLEKEWPNHKTPDGKPMPEMALVGKSNVGKSSLINALLGQKHLAKASSIPGKTQRMNFFLIDEKLLLVDLPGYGYAKAPKEYAKEWSLAIDTYFTSRASLQLILLLIDARRDLSEEDQQIIDWATSRNLAFLIVLTKMDKLSSADSAKKLVETKALFGDCIAFTIHDKNARRQLIAAIQKRIHP